MSMIGKFEKRDRKKNHIELKKDYKLKDNVWVDMSHH